MTGSNYPGKAASCLEKAEDKELFHGVQDTVYWQPAKGEEQGTLRLKSLIILHCDADISPARFPLTMPTVPLRVNEYSVFIFYFLYLAEAEPLWLCALTG